jgi:hypothetical protein
VKGIEGSGTVGDTETVYLPGGNQVAKFSKEALRAAETQRRRLTSADDFSRYILQGMVRDNVFKAALLAFKTQMQQLAKTRRLRQTGLDWYLQELRDLRSQFDTHIQTLRRQRLIEFTLPIELSLFSVRAQWFWQYQAPQIQQGWQQAIPTVHPHKHPEE